MFFYVWRCILFYVIFFYVWECMRSWDFSQYIWECNIFVNIVRHHLGTGTTGRNDLKMRTSLDVWMSQKTKTLWNMTSRVISRGKHVRQTRIWMNLFFVGFHRTRKYGMIYMNVKKLYIQFVNFCDDSEYDFFRLGCESCSQVLPMCHGRRGLFGAKWRIGQRRLPTHAHDAW